MGILRFTIPLTLAFCLLLLPTAPQASQINHKVIEKAGHSVVHLRDITDGEYSFCTAFAIAPQTFMTAAHCLGTRTTVDFVIATVMKRDNPRDLAIIHADMMKPALSFRNRSLKVYESALGFGFAHDMPFPVAVDVTVLELRMAPDNSGIYPGVWYAGSFIGGMSGGPVIDRDGQVVGIVQRAGVGVSYGVDVKTIREFLANPR